MPSASTLMAAAVVLLKLPSAVRGHCDVSDYPPAQAALSQFPGVWEPALQLLSGDSAALAHFHSFSSSIPNIPVKGKNGVTPSSVLKSYNPSDPDCWWTYSNCVKSSRAGIWPDVASVPEPGTLGYGFDDGPACEHDAFLDFMDSNKQKATFFYIGSNVMSMPLQAQRAAHDGHQICVHTWSHMAMTAFENEAAFAELYYAIKAIKLVTGYTPKCWRPPMGDVDDRIRYIAQQLNLTLVIWEYDSNDWQFGEGSMTAAQIDANYDSFIADAKNGTFTEVGAILLTHELDNFTMQTAVNYYPKLSAAFKHIVPIATALNVTQPYVETNFTMPTFAQYIGAAPELSALPALAPVPTASLALSAERAFPSSASVSAPSATSALAGNSSSPPSSSPSSTSGVPSTSPSRTGAVAALLAGAVGCIGVWLLKEAAAGLPWPARSYRATFIIMLILDRDSMIEAHNRFCHICIREAALGMPPPPADLPPGTLGITLLPPALAQQVLISDYVCAGSLGIAIWDLLNNCRAEYELLTRSRLRLPIVAYVFARVFSLAYILGFTLLGTYPLGNCSTMFRVFDSFYPVATSATSLLFFFRVRGVYASALVPTIVFGTLWLGVLATSVTIPIGGRAIPIGPTDYCLITSVAPYVGAAAIMVTIHDTAVYLAISYCLVTNTHIVQTNGQLFRALICGKYLPSFSRSLFVDGQVYYMVSVISNILVTLMVYLPVSPLYHGLLAVPNMALTSVMACRVYRNTRLGLSQRPTALTLPTTTTRNQHIGNHTTLNAIPLQFSGPPGSEIDTVDLDEREHAQRTKVEPETGVVVHSDP
ncbi:unnamed protein product [Mycena citricolor]|uniref:chitin deacetylase n=1 Tax=Mycena citricolor TaxID=2018698 RepID=A0AAD2GZ70_9AGAR|nr:unnamed protein product [Mycena citricolor]